MISYDADIDVADGASGGRRRSRLATYLLSMVTDTMKRALLPILLLCASGVGAGAVHPEYDLSAGSLADELKFPMAQR